MRIAKKSSDECDARDTAIRNSKTPRIQGEHHESKKRSNETITAQRCGGTRARLQIQSLRITLESPDRHWIQRV